MDLERELSQIFEESVVGLSPPIHTIVAEADRRGRRLRVIRRLRIAGTAATVAALATTGTLIGLRAHGERSVGPSSNSVASPTAPASGTTDGSDPVVPASTDALLKILVDQLPNHQTIANYRPGPTKPSLVDFTVDLNSTPGPVTVSVELNRVLPTDGPLECGNQIAKCAVSVVGSVTQRAIQSITSQGGLFMFEVTTERDGTRLTITTWNGLTEIDGSTRRAVSTRPTPLFGIEAWRAVADSPRWGFQVPSSVADAGTALAGTAR